MCLLWSSLLLATPACLAGDLLSASDMPGIKVGEKAPDFALKDQNGKVHTLGEFTKQGKVALVFYRSASW